MSYRGANTIPAGVFVRESLQRASESTTHFRVSGPTVMVQLAGDVQADLVDLAGALLHSLD